MKEWCKNTIRLSLVLAVLSAALPAQQVKIKRISLKEFPKIRLTLSIESEWGAPIPVDTASLVLSEDGQPMSDLSVTAQDSVQVPIHTVIVLDKSGSMKGSAIEQARIGAAAFTDMMRGADTAAYVTFDTRVTVVQEFTGDREALKEKILATGVGSDTALLDGVYQGLELFSPLPREGVRVLLVLTDGRENKSHKKLEEVLALATEQGVSLFTIGLGENIQPEMLGELARKSEGNYYPAPQPEQLKGIYEQISLLLHSQLSLSYTSPKPMDDQFRTIRVSLPYMGKTLAGEKGYLSAKESRIPTELLRRQREEENQRAQEARVLGQGAEQARQKRERKLLIILGSILAVLVLLLVVAVVRKRK